jgi:hypothetical protein
VFASVVATATCFAAAARAANRLYWADAGGTPTPKVSLANLDGSGNGPLNTSGAAAEDCCPFGLAIDSAGGKVYWGSDDANGVSYANLDGSGGGGDLTTTSRVTRLRFRVVGPARR